MRIHELVGQIWSIMGFVTFLQTLIPAQLRNMLVQRLNSLLDRFNVYCHVNVPEFKGNAGVNSNDLFTDSELYVESLEGASKARKLTVFRKGDSGDVGITPDSGQIIEDSFLGTRVLWAPHVIQQNNQSSGRDGLGVGGESAERHSYIIKVNKIDKHFIKAYFDHITRYAHERKHQYRNLTLYTNKGDASYGRGWTNVRFNHPSTFKSLALDPPLKNMILQDLDRFREGKQFYEQIGRPWKRGYLLYGPPGTGKSSLIAAIANYMRYDIYDLELTRVSDNTELRALLTQTKEKSIIIIEDIDCSLQMQDRTSAAGGGGGSGGGNNASGGSKVTLSGLLNFADGLWSCCGQERIIIFTTNHKDQLDPALLRCGRMDVHILLSFMNFPAFKVLVKNYLRIDDHPLYPSIEDKIGSGAEMTPAEIIEVLMSKIDDPREALTAVDSALGAKLSEKESRLSTQITQTINDDQDAADERSPPNGEQEQLHEDGSVYVEA